MVLIRYSATSNRPSIVFNAPFAYLIYPKRALLRLRKVFYFACLGRMSIEHREELYSDHRMGPQPGCSCAKPLLFKATRCERSRTAVAWQARPVWTPASTNEHLGMQKQEERCDSGVDTYRGL